MVCCSRLQGNHLDGVCSRFQMKRKRTRRAWLTPITRRTKQKSEHVMSIERKQIKDNSSTKTPSTISVDDYSYLEDLVTVLCWRQNFLKEKKPRTSIMVSFFYLFYHWKLKVTSILAVKTSSINLCLCNFDTINKNMGMFCRSIACFLLLTPSHLFFCGQKWIFTPALSCCSTWCHWSPVPTGAHWHGRMLQKTTQLSFILVIFYPRAAVLFKKCNNTCIHNPAFSSWGDFTGKRSSLLYTSIVIVYIV